MTTWQRDPRVLWRRSFDRIVLLAPTRDDAVLLDGVGRIVWELLEQPTGERELIVDLADAFDRPVAEVEAEVAAFLADLQDTGALVAR